MEIRFVLLNHARGIGFVLLRGHVKYSMFMCLLLHRCNNEHMQKGTIPRRWDNDTRKGSEEQTRADLNTDKWMREGLNDLRMHIVHWHVQYWV